MKRVLLKCVLRNKDLHWMMAWIAVIPMLVPLQVVGAENRSATRTKLLVALTETEHEVRELRREVNDVRNLQVIATANVRTFNVEMTEVRAKVAKVTQGNQEAEALIMAWVAEVEKAVADEKVTLAEAKELNCQLASLNCRLDQLNCSLAGLACAIDEALTTALFVGILIGVGISFLIPHPPGVPPGVPGGSVPIH